MRQEAMIAIHRDLNSLNLRPAAASGKFTATSIRSIELVPRRGERQI
jgi:hypothetical protein